MMVIKVNVNGKGHRVKINRFPPWGKVSVKRKVHANLAFSSLFGRDKPSAVCTVSSESTESWYFSTSFPHKGHHCSAWVNGKMLTTVFMFRCYLFIWQTYQRLYGSSCVAVNTLLFYPSFIYTAYPFEGRFEAGLWTEGESTQRKPTQTRRGHTNSTQRDPWANRDLNLIAVRITGSPCFQ